jgi:catechol 2,3-dioxygenase-like lactoylglutathione lyase family enzyme
MPSPNYVLAYVADPPRSAALYRKLLDADPVEVSDTFALFDLPGTAFALRSRDDVEPRATLPGGTELAFAVESDAEVRRRRNQWVKLGLHIIQEPVQMAFGYTFTAADPDGHRLRVFNPS